MTNPESKPIIVLDFGAQYSKLIAHARFLLIALLIFTSLGCTLSVLYKIRDVRVVDSEGSNIEFEIRKKRDLVIVTKDLKFEIARTSSSYIWKSSRIGYFDVSIIVTNTSSQRRKIALRSLRITPFVWIEGDAPDEFAPLILDARDISVISRERWEFSSSGVDTMSLEPGESLYFGAPIETPPWTIKRGQVSIVLYDHQKASEIRVDFIFYKGRRGKESLILQTPEQSDE